MKKRIVVAAVLAVLIAACAQKPQKPTDFFDLVRDGTPQAVQAAISKGADLKALNSLGETPLMWAACYNKNPEVITTLLKAGAGVNVKGPWDFTALMIAAQFNPNPAVITTLLKAGADIKARDSHYGGTPLMFAADSNTPEVITTLLKAGADIKDKGRFERPDICRDRQLGPKSDHHAPGGRSRHQEHDQRGLARLDGRCRQNTVLDYAKANKSLEDTDALKQLEEASK